MWSLRPCPTPFHDSIPCVHKGVIPACSKAAGSPIPEANSKAGESMAPAQTITNFLASIR